jgi:hypothetical protein
MLRKSGLVALVILTQRRWITEEKKIAASTALMPLTMAMVL